MTTILTLLILTCLATGYFAMRLHGLRRFLTGCLLLPRLLLRLTGPVLLIAAGIVILLGLIATITAITPTITPAVPAVALSVMALSAGVVLVALWRDNSRPRKASTERPPAAVVTDEAKAQHARDRHELRQLLAEAKKK